MFIFVRTNLYSRLGYNPIEYFMTGVIAYLIEGNWKICIL